MSAAPLHAAELVRGPEKPLNEVVSDESSPCAGTSVCSPGRPGLPTATLRALTEGLHAGEVEWGALGLDSMDAAQTSSGSTRSAPVLSLAPHHNAYRDATQGSATLSYSTPAYVSMDQPRSVSLVFSSALLRPMSFVQVNATDNSTEAPVKMSLRLKNEFGAWMTLSNGTQEIFYQSGSGATRLAAQFEEPRSEPLSYSYTAVVRSWWADGTSSESTISVRAAKVSSGTSEFGRGWTMAGFQQLYNQGGAVHVVENGTGTFFWEVCDGNGCRYPGPEGDFTTITWDGSGWRRAYPDSTIVRFAAYQWNQRGRMEWVEDRFGNRTTYGYDTLNRLTSITDPVGKAITFGYNAEGVLGWIEDPMGRRVNTSTESGYLWRLVDPDSSLALSLHFDPGVLRTSWSKGANRDAAGTGWDYGYDAFGQLASVTAPQVSTTDAGVMRPVTYVKSLEAAVLPAPGTGTTLTNAAPRVLPQNVRVETTDPRQNTTKVAVNRLGNPIRVEAPLGRVATASYNAHGQVTRQVTHSGQVTRYVYGGPTLRQVQDSTAGHTVNYEYDHYAPHLVRRVWGSVPEENYAYFLTGTKTDSVRITVAGRTSTVRFDSRGRQELAIDPEGHATLYVYNDGSSAAPGLGNLETIRTGSLAAVQNNDYRQRITSVARDGYGRQIGTTDPLGRSSSVAYDSLNRTTRSINATNDTTRYEYATAGHLWKVTDPKGQVYEYVRNPLGWTTEEKVPGPSGQQTVTHRYDRAGNHTETTNQRGQTVRRAYDALGRVQSLTDLSTSAVTAYAYGPQDRWLAVSNAESTDTVHYDTVGRATQQITRRGTARYALSSSYNAKGMREGLTMTAPWTRSIGYRYNAAMELDTLIDLAGGRTVLSYNGDGQLYNTALPLASPLVIRQDIPTTHVSARTRYFNSSGYSNPIEAEFGVGYTQDKLGRIATRWSSDMQKRRTYGYDPAGRMDSYQDEVALTSIGCTYTADWDPDSGVKLGAGSGMCDEGGFAPSDHWGLHTYDRVGNHTNDGAVTQPGNNRLMQFRGYTMGYDNDGNLTSKSGNGETLTYSWNAFGQLASVTRNGQTTTFGYDGFGRRVRKTGPQGIRRYVYDGDNLFMEFNGAGTLVREYTYYPGVDNPHSVRQWGKMYYYLMEAPGHVAGLVDSQGQIVSRYKYNPWGELESVQDALDQPLRYTAREYDSETGLYFYRARYYDPSLRRFISEDPIGLAGGINPYAYVSNDPINATDPYGLCEIDEERSFFYTVKSSTAGHLDKMIFVPICKIPETKDHGGGGGGGISSLRDFGNYVGTDQYWADVWDNLVNGIADQCGTPGANPQTCVTVAGMPSWISPAGGGFKFSITVAKHADDLTKAGLMARPYMRYPTLLMNEIMKGRGRADPGGVAGALRWDAPGMLNGSRGTWELVVEMAQSRVIHFVFKGGR